ncbi:MAG: hypothetical protein SCK28_06965 [Bacillota bacterium]|nr:hypothetical protein [Bacillota bacterium]
MVIIEKLYKGFLVSLVVIALAFLIQQPAMAQNQPFFSEENSYKELHLKHGNNTLIAVSKSDERYNINFNFTLADEKGTPIWNYQMTQYKSSHINTLGLLEDGSYLISTSNTVFQIKREGNIGFVLDWNSIADTSKLGGTLAELLIGCGSTTTEDFDILMQTKVDLENIIAVSETPKGNILIVDKGLNEVGRVLEIAKDGIVVRRIEDINNPTEAAVSEDGILVIKQVGDNLVVEYDENGKVINSRKLEPNI